MFVSFLGKNWSFYELNYMTNSHIIDEDNILAMSSNEVKGTNQ